MSDARLWDIFKPETEYLNDEDFNKRLNVCKVCPFFINISKQCSRCGCFMNLKAKMSHATCPIGNW
jgi:hypothetical protein